MLQQKLDELKVENEGYKFIKVEVSRTEYTDIYVKVPEDFNASNLAKIENRVFLQEAAEGMDDHEWEMQCDYKGYDELKVHSVKDVTEEEAVQFTYIPFEGENK